MTEGTTPLQRRIAAGALAVLAAPNAEAQQFTQAVGALPGPARWSEGVAAVDVDLDGDLDLVFADGDGFASAGPKRQNVLVVNRLVETGSLAFVDESVARLGMSVSNAKMVVGGDVDGDGWPDLVFANGFNTDPPFLFINRGAVQPGYFDQEGAARGLTEPLNSAGVQLGDVDDDGDLDLVLTDSGTSLLGGAGGVPRLYLNDGTGHFTEAAAQLPAATKRAHMDVNLVDLDDDWDLDLFITNRANNGGGDHYLMLGDGAGAFTDASTLVPTTSGSVYEAEVGDLDWDSDLDLFFVSLSGFSEGHMRNELVETSTLGFTAGTPQPGSVDDNELALFDYDMDGDLDVFVGSLGFRERVYRNNGGLGFTDVTGVLPSVADSTLDLAVADVDNDGDYDVITAQGESGNFTNRLYLNGGPADTRAPRVVDVDAPTQAPGWPAIVHAKVRDDLIDDGEAYLEVTALVERIPAATVHVDVTPAGFSPAAITVPAGTLIEFRDAGAGPSTLTGSAAGAQWVRMVPAGGSAARAFVAPLTHVVSAFPLLGTLQVDVTGAAPEAPATHSGNDLFRMALAAPPTGPTDLVALVVRATDWPGNVGWSDSFVLRDPSSVGERYCTPRANSSGAPGRLVLRGSDVLALQDLTVEAYSLPQNSFGYLLAARTRDAMPVSQGVLCLGQPIGRLSLHVQSSGAAGAIGFAMPWTGLPPSVQFAVGETWNFQYWFRDANPAVGANFTDAREVVWQ